MKRKFKLKNNLKFYGIISLTFMLLIVLGFMGVRDYSGRKNDVVNDDNQVAINNNQQNFGDGSGYAPGGTQGTKRTTTTTKKTTAKKTTAKKAEPKTAPKAEVKAPVAKTAPKAEAKKPATKTTAKKPVAKKTTAKKPATKKSAK
ncbi:MAG: hypothetical protein MR862_03390 [Clostridia bacterium]|nr:hypothetical protein [Clostridia bacterium]